MNRHRIAVVVKDKALEECLCRNLEFMGESATPLDRSDGSLTGSRVLNERCTIVITDNTPPHAFSSHLPVIGLSQEQSLPASNLVASVQMPIRLNEMIDALYLAQMFIKQQNFDWPSVEKENLLFPKLVGISPEIQKVRELMGKAAAKDITVLITGESGTGKEIVARSLHESSRRAEGPFVPVNCGAIPAELIESELFGHEKGAFTGAVNTRPGRFELADGGTIFLDEVGDLPHLMQVKLLRVIQERSFERVGGNESLKTNVRIIAATHCDLEEMIRQGDFREDLYYRLNVFPVHVPALREHKQDIPVLINTLLQRIQAQHQVTLQFESQAMLVLSEYNWPGNVRELANLIERMTVQYPDSVVGAAQLPGKFGAGTAAADHATDQSEITAVKTMLETHTTPLLPINGIDLKEYLTDLEKNLIRQALDDTNLVVARAADRLNIRRTTLVEKMRKYGLNRIELVQGQN